ncbi:MAG TPA: hypothetical protein VMN60_00100 [Longimicrobiales bacterium]|nr:hypothetical protein [Longimicrobiales bacterium]
MRRIAIGLLPLLLAVQAQAQVRVEERLRAGTWVFTAELGGAAFTDFQRGQATLLHGGGGELERRVSASTAATVGARVGYWPTDSWALRAGLSYAPSTFTVAHDEAGEPLLDAADDGASETYASLGIWLADVTAIFRFPRSFGRVLPYGIMGAGAVRYAHGDDAQLPPEARTTFESGQRTGAAAVFGLGGSITLQRHDTLLSFELTNHLVRSPLAGAKGGEQFDVDGVALRLDAADEHSSPGLTNNLRLIVGLTLSVR